MMTLNPLLMSPVPPVYSAWQASSVLLFSFDLLRNSPLLFFTFFFYYFSKPYSVTLGKEFFRFSTLFPKALFLFLFFSLFFVLPIFCLLSSSYKRREKQKNKKHPKHANLLLASIRNSLPKRFRLFTRRIPRPARSGLRMYFGFSFLMSVRKCSIWSDFKRRTRRLSLQFI